MENETTPGPQVTVEHARRIPKCPYCEKEFKLGAIPVRLPNGVRHLVYFCGDCEKVINCTILEQAQRVIVDPRVQIPPELLDEFGR